MYTKLAVVYLRKSDDGPVLRSLLNAQSPQSRDHRCRVAFWCRIPVIRKLSHQSQEGCLGHHVTHSRGNLAGIDGCTGEWCFRMQRSIGHSSPSHPNATFVRRASCRTSGVSGLAPNVAHVSSTAKAADIYLQLMPLDRQSRLARKPGHGFPRKFEVVPQACPKCAFPGWRRLDSPGMAPFVRRPSRPLSDPESLLTQAEPKTETTETSAILAPVSDGG